MADERGNGNGWVSWALKATMAFMQVLLVVGITWLASWSVAVTDRLARVEERVKMMQSEPGPGR